MNNKIGRPTSLTSQTLQKLEWAFRLGASDREACSVANISPQTLYNHQLKNPEFLEQKEAWKSDPIIKARKTVVEALSYDPYLALKYLEKKLPEEFSRKVDFNFNNNQIINNGVVILPMKKNLA